MHPSSLLAAVLVLMGLVGVQAAPIQLIQGEFVQGKGWIATETIKVLQTRETQDVTRRSLPLPLQARLVPFFQDASTVVHTLPVEILRAAATEERTEGGEMHA